MNRLRSFLGYTWAALAIFAAAATFFGSHEFSRALASATGMQVWPWFSGGEVTGTIHHGAYTTAVHRPVFDYLIGERKEGFIQVNWAPAAGLPPIVREVIDYTGDGKGDFEIALNTGTGKAELKALSPSVVSLGDSYRLRDGWAVRINLRR